MASMYRLRIYALLESFSIIMKFRFFQKFQENEVVQISLPIIYTRPA